MQRLSVVFLWGASQFWHGALLSEVIRAGSSGMGGIGPNIAIKEPAALAHVRNAAFSLPRSCGSAEARSHNSRSTTFFKIQEIYTL